MLPLWDRAKALALEGDRYGRFLFFYRHKNSRHWDPIRKHRNGTMGKHIKVLSLYWTVRRWNLLL